MEMTSAPMKVEILERMETIGGIHALISILATIFKFTKAPPGKASISLQGLINCGTNNEGAGHRVQVLPNLLMLPYQTTPQNVFVTLANRPIELLQFPAKN